MTDVQRPSDTAYEHTGAPAGFTLDAEASRHDQVAPGIVARAFEPDPDDDEVEAASAVGVADDGDDDAIDDPDDDGSPLHDI